MICYIHTLPGEDLLVYLRDELGLEKLYKQLIRLTDPEKDQMKYFSALFREGHYFNEDEIRKIYSSQVSSVIDIKFVDDKNKEVNTISDLAEMIE